MQQEQAFNADVVKNYDDFIAKEKSDADFANVVVFAVGNLFASLPQSMQQILANAFAKVEQRQADTRRVFARAKLFLASQRNLQKREKQNAEK